MRSISNLASQVDGGISGATHRFSQAIPSLSTPLLIALVSWLVVIFLGFRLLAPPNPTNTLALVAGAFSVACAVFIILELNYPFAGVIRLPSGPMTNVLNQLAK